jgi:hypothetical protein
MKHLRTPRLLLVCTLLFTLACGCQPSRETKTVEFPADLKGLSQGEIPLQQADSTFVDALPATLKCNIWIGWSGSRCGLVRDCENYTYEEAKRIGDRVSAAANEGVRAICSELNCPNIRIRNVKWSESCKNRLLCVSVKFEFMCAK